MQILSDLFDTIATHYRSAKVYPKAPPEPMKQSPEPGLIEPETPEEKQEIHYTLTL
jgi:cell division septation protein DedD